MPEFEEFLSPAYRLDTPNAACSVMLNCYLEILEKGPRRGKFRLVGVPGMNKFGLTLPDSPLRGMLEIDGGNRLFVVAGSTVFEVFRDGTYTALAGSVALNQHPVTMVTNGFQLAIASGGQLYIVEGVAGSTVGTVNPAQYTDGTPVLADTVTFQDDYFIIDVPNSKQVASSNLAPDGAIWDAGDVAIKEGYPDNVARVFADNEQLWIFGFDSTEVWQNIGQQGFPYQRIQGAVFPIGVTSPYSVAGVRGFRFWLYQRVVYSAYGLDPVRVSDAGVEAAMAKYGDISDAEGWCYALGQHIFFVLNFPSVKRTWVYDESNKTWHERGLWRNGRQELYHGRCYAHAFSIDIVGDPETGEMYQLDPFTYTDTYGLPLRRQRTADYITVEEKNRRHNQLTLDMDTGVGLDVSADAAGFAPLVIMRYSDNRAKNWSSDLEAELGEVGETYVRVVYNQLGSARIGRTYDIWVTDPVPFSVNGAYLKIGQAEVGR